MKYLLVILLVLVVGCNEEKKDDMGNTTSSPYGLSVAEINGCQYVIYNGVDKCAMVHAGNCSNYMFHTTNKEP